MNTNKKINLIMIGLLMITASIASPGVNFWRGMSVSTSDNLDAIVLNPAGLGIIRGSQSGFHVVSPEDGDKSYHFLHRGDGLGFSMYGEHKANYRLGFGGNISNNLYFGYVWDSHKIHTLGFISRPNNMVSFGYTYGWDSSTEIRSSRLGVAFRPIGHRVTLGADLIVPDMDLVNDFDELEDNSEVYGFAEFQPFDGIYLTASTNEDGDYGIQLSLDFGTSAVYSSQTEYSDQSISEFGMISHTEVQNTIIKKKTKPGSIYYRMDMSNYFIEEKPYYPGFNFDFNLNPFDRKIRGTQLRTWINKLDELTNDDEVGGLIIDYKYMAGGFGKLFEVHHALKRFKDSGKKIIVYSEAINNMGSYILAMADEIHLAPLGEVDLRGLNLEITFYKGLLDKLDIVGEFEQISPYKTAPDPFLREDMSAEMRENYGQVFEDLYNEFLNGIASGHGWSAEETQAIIDKGPYMAYEALNAGLIDGTMFPDEFEKYIEEIDGEKIEIVHWDKLGDEEKYVHEWTTKNIPKIAIVYAVGGIVSRYSNPGSGGSTQMGDKTIMKAIKSARENKDVDAIVFRIDSGGGSALASDMILREVNKTTSLDTNNVKPIIASMSDVAGSGGYWIACQTDKIVAYPTTITGSIGVLSGRINYSGLLKKVGITSDKIKYGERSDFYSSHKLWTDEEKAKVRKVIVDIYDMFKEKVADGRGNLEIEDLDEIALGRIWSGNQAKSNSLIDEIGGLSKAIDMAKEAANIPVDQEVEIIEYPKHPDKFSFMKGLQLKNKAEFYIPEEILEQLEALNIIPIIENDEIQLIMPFTVSVD